MTMPPLGSDDLGGGVFRFYVSFLCDFYVAFYVTFSRIVSDNSLHRSHR